MGRFIVKLAEDEYVEWSTVVDAPVTVIHTREEIAEYLLEEHGRIYAEKIPGWLARADEKGYSARGYGGASLSDVLADNRAGNDGSELALEEIREQYRD